METKTEYCDYKMVDKLFFCGASMFTVLMKCHAGKFREVTEEEENMLIFFFGKVVPNAAELCRNQTRQWVSGCWSTTVENPLAGTVRGVKRVVG